MGRDKTVIRQRLVLSFLFSSSSPIFHFHRQLFVLKAVAIKHRQIDVISVNKECINKTVRPVPVRPSWN